ncbi:MAG: hypothetical protein QM690_09430 [Sphingobium sp.]
MKLFNRLCRLIDWDIGRGAGVNAGSIALVIGFVPWVAFISFGNEPGYFSTIMIGLLVVWTISWFTFVAWRW